MNCLICFDTWVYFMEYTVDQDKYYSLANSLDFVISLLFFIFEIFVNGHIVYHLFRKVLNQTNSYYKVIVVKLISVLTLYLILDIVLITLNIKNKQVYACFFWGINYSFKIQIETLCLGKIRDMIVTMEHHENSDPRRNSRAFE
ncbi:hypothetical protein CONCODRAFT_4107 [Conidiobolus coronatus NRRL 28638]|uniref:Uncharacterized protein n=1 Tax=Conidiobolus coronatus (strain ATCC 28846 / CBS 209.66 / NRRL 28638) TaxID=796925 RepID=A0A137PDC0_CONC2|nr:hypothetical protein CONCODRAFT_4107 [Conidiobolus coronatus NRRL 28638]|eukprot:KXN72962.1 hypothetical protein CONCODRAFT_4107 [Conidiobolus coronatus NRRL 28638]